MRRSLPEHCSINTAKSNTPRIMANYTRAMTRNTRSLNTSDMGKHLRLLTIAFFVVATISNAQKLVVSPIGTSKQAKELWSGASICPRDYHQGFTIECWGPLWPPVSFFVNERRVSISRVSPYTLAGINKTTGTRIAYEAYSIPDTKLIECVSSLGGPKRSAIVHFECGEWLRWRWPVSGGCVVVNASRPLSDIGAGWENAPDGGLIFRPNDPTSNVAKPGVAPLTYGFRVPVQGRYAIAADMTSSDWNEHNDIFLRFSFGEGLALQRLGSYRVGGLGFIKAFHNRNGRATESFADNSDRHSFSTVSVLQPNTRYYIAVSGRSSQVIVHNLVLFPCEESQCFSSSPYWKNKVETCKVSV